MDFFVPFSCTVPKARKCVCLAVSHRRDAVALGTNGVVKLCIVSWREPESIHCPFFEYISRREHA